MRSCAPQGLLMLVLATPMARVAAAPADDKAAPSDKQEIAFKPKTLTVAVGTQVTWINGDDVPHTATAKGKPRPFASGALDTDERYSFVFQRPGTYDYFCAVHPHMTGKVIVK